MRKAKKTACFCHGNRDEGQAAGTGVKNHQPQTPVNPQQQRVIAPYLKAHAVRRENIFRLQTSIDLQYETIEDSACTVSYRDAVCGLCVKTVSMALDMPLRRLQASSRSSAEAALARQIAMYLCHTIFSLLLTEIGIYFQRDRTTVAYACSLVEDKRDEMAFDVLLEQLESLLVEARTAMSICVEHYSGEADPAYEETEDGQYEDPCDTRLLAAGCGN